MASLVARVVSLHAAVAAVARESPLIHICEAISVCFDAMRCIWSYDRDVEHFL